MWWDFLSSQEPVPEVWEAVGKLESMTGVKDMKTFTNVALSQMKRRNRPHSLVLLLGMEKSLHSIQQS